MYCRFHYDPFFLHILKVFHKFHTYKKLQEFSERFLNTVLGIIPKILVKISIPILGGIFPEITVIILRKFSEEFVQIFFSAAFQCIIWVISSEFAQENPSTLLPPVIYPVVTLGDLHVISTTVLPRRSTKACSTGFK